jgi:hypothetical protein
MPSRGADSGSSVGLHHDVSIDAVERPLPLNANSIGDISSTKLGSQLLYSMRVTFRRLRCACHDPLVEVPSLEDRGLSGLEECCTLHCHWKAVERVTVLQSLRFRQNFCNEAWLSEQFFMWTSDNSEDEGVVEVHV